MSDLAGQYLHKDLEMFLWKLSPENTPSYNINTDLKCQVRLWFHNGLGALITNPFLTGAVDKFQEAVSGKFHDRNVEFEKYGHNGIFTKANYHGGAFGGMGATGDYLGALCFDLTPFIQSVTLPAIGTSNNPDVETLLGTMKVGSFSPYSSDGGKEITFTLLDTQYSILDAMFYPWLKMVGNAKWYSSATAFTEHSTPYPICTVEVSTPMRFYKVGNAIGNYVYEYIGARPKDYTIPEINTESRSNLTRTLSMMCDLVLVDMQSDSIVSETAGGQGILDSPSGGAPQLDSGVFAAMAPTYAEAEGAVPAQAKPDTATDVDIKITITRRSIDTTAMDAADSAAGTPPGSANAAGPFSAASGDEGGVAPGGGEGGSGEGGQDGGDGGNTPGEGEGSESTSMKVVSFVYTPPDPWVPSYIARSAADLSNSASPIEVLKRDDPTEDPRQTVFNGITNVNERYHELVNDLKQCVLRDPFDYPSANVNAALTSAISQGFDVMQVDPILNSATIGKFDGVEDALKEMTKADESTTFHYLPYTIYSGKQAGVANECQNEDINRAENFGRVVSLHSILTRIESNLQLRHFNSPFFAALSFKALRSLEQSPNTSFGLHLDSRCNLWNVGLYLTPFHNMLAEIGQFPNAKVLEPNINPFLFRYEYYKPRRDEHGQILPDGPQEAALMSDLIRLHNAEKEEWNLGDAKHPASIGSASVWEIIDDDLNHTGTYWCKVWVKDGPVYFCKLDYDGSVMRDDLFAVGVELPDTLEYVTLPQEEPEENEEAQPPVALPWLVKTKCNFSRETVHWLFNSKVGVQIRKDGQRGEQYNPLTAVEASKKYVRAVECDLKLRPTGFWHYEEAPQPGDVEYENAVEKDEDGNVLSYTMHYHDEGQEQQVYYTLESRTAYVVQSAMDRETRPLLPMKMGSCPARQHPAEGDSFDSLIVKHHELWVPPISVKEYVTIHTTNSNEDLFEQYIPVAVDYVCQYLHQKKRAAIAGKEQGKLRQLMARLSSRMLDINSMLKNDEADVHKVVSLQELADFFTLCYNIIELSNKYNSLTDSEIKLEQKVDMLKGELAKLTEEYDSLDEHQNLPERVKLLDSVQLARIACGKSEERLENLRLDQQTCVQDYNDKVKAREALLEKEISIDWKGKAEICKLQKWVNICAEVIYNHVLLDWFSQWLSTMYSLLSSFYDKRLDAWKQMQRLIAFFDRDIENISKATDTAKLDELILLADWKAWGDNDLTQEERADANALSYRLRTMVKIPELQRTLAALMRRRERISNLQDRVTDVLYDVTYATPGYVPPDYEDEQKPIDLAQVDETPVQEDPEAAYLISLEQVLPVYKELHPEFENYTDEQLLNSLLLVVASTYLILQNPQMQEDIIAAKEAIEKTKALRDDFKKSVNQELQLLAATKEKQHDLMKGIENIDKANEEMVKKANANELPREENAKFRKNVLQKVELQSSLDEVNTIYREMMEHYEKQTTNTLANYDDNVQAAVDKYDALMNQLMIDIDFKRKIIDMAQDLSTIGKYK